MRVKAKCREECVGGSGVGALTVVVIFVQE